MHGTGVPLVTPFDEDGTLDASRLRAAAEWVLDGGADFVVPAGSNGEAELLTMDERARVIETVTGAVDVPVLAGTGHPSLAATREQTARAAAAGADAVLVVTPFYHDHDPATIETYYRDLAATVDPPLYLYTVPRMTGVDLATETVLDLAAHEGIAGIKDSSGDLARLARLCRGQGTETAAFTVLVGSGGLYAAALDAGAEGGVLALANVVPEVVAAVHEHHRSGEPAAARELNAAVVELNRAITAEYGVPGVKAAMRYRGAPAGFARSPHRPLEGSPRRRVERLVDEALALV